MLDCGLDVGESTIPISSMLGASSRIELAAASVMKKPPPCRVTVEHTPLWNFQKHVFHHLLLFFCSSQNPSRWKAMSEEALKSVCAPGTTTSLPPLPPLCASSLDPAATSNQLELELRFLVSEHRRVNYNTWLKGCALHRSHAARPLLARWCLSYCALELQQQGCNMFARRHGKEQIFTHTHTHSHSCYIWLILDWRVEILSSPLWILQDLQVTTQLTYWGI